MIWIEKYQEFGNNVYVILRKQSTDVDVQETISELETLFETVKNGKYLYFMEDGNELVFVFKKNEKKLLFD